MIRYELATGPDAPRVVGPQADALIAEGFAWASSFRAKAGAHAAFEGELFVDPEPTTAAAVYVVGGRVGASLHTELEDGTYVMTEQRPPALRYLALRPGVSLPIDGARLRFPASRDTRELVAKHREHVAEVARERGARPRASMSAERYVELRHRHQLARQPQRDFQKKAARIALALGLTLAPVGAVAGAVAGAGVAPAAIALVTALALPILTYLFFAPWLMMAGLGPKSAPPSALPAVAAQPPPARTVRLHDPTARATALATIAMLCGILSTALFLASMTEGGHLTWMPVVLAVAAGSWTSAFVERVLYRKAPRLREAVLRVEDGTIRGPRVPVDVARVAGAVIVRSHAPTLMAFDARGVVILRAEGDAEALGPLARAIAPARERFPLENRVARLAARLVGVPLACALAALAVGAPRPALLAAGGLGIALGPLLGLLPRSFLEVGVDGLLVGSPFGRTTFLPFGEIASIDADLRGGTLVVHERGGAAVRLRLAVRETAAKAVAAWKAHADELSRRDDAKIVRRRLEVEDPYRATEAETAELAEAVLDSAEHRSVRVRAARRLAMRPEDDRVRDDAAGRVVDPEVRRALTKRNA